MLEFVEKLMILYTLEYMNKEYSTRDMWPLEELLGCMITRDIEKTHLTISQP